MALPWNNRQIYASGDQVTYIGNTYASTQDWNLNRVPNDYSDEWWVVVNAGFVESVGAGTNITITGGGVNPVINASTVIPTPAGVYTNPTGLTVDAYGRTTAVSTSLTAPIRGILASEPLYANPPGLDGVVNIGLGYDTDDFAVATNPGLDALELVARGPSGQYNTPLYVTVNSKGVVTELGPAYTLSASLPVVKTAFVNPLTGATNDVFSLNPTGTPGTYAYPTSVQTNTYGMIESITAGAAPVASVSASSGITIGGTATNPTVAITPSGVTAGAYNQLASYTFNNLGQVTAATDGAVGGGYSDYLYWDPATTSWRSDSTKIHLGRFAGLSTQGSNAVAIGSAAGNANQGPSAVAVGPNAGSANQGQNSVCIGTNAGATNTGTSAVVIGVSTGATGAGAIAIGQACSANASGSVAVGRFAGANTADCVAVGNQAGLSGMATLSTAIGAYSGNAQATQSVAVGAYCGGTSQATQAVSVGAYGSGSAQQTNQGAGAVSIGFNAAASAQGINAIAIGRNAAGPSQPARSIVLNATNTAITPSLTDSTFISPIRASSTYASQILMYTSAGEVVQRPNPFASDGSLTMSDDILMGGNDISGVTNIGTSSVAYAANGVGGAPFTLSSSALVGSEGTIAIDGTNVLSATSSGNSGQHLAVTVNGTPYKIALQNN